MKTETMDKLYLEISHFTKARNFREIKMLRALEAVRRHGLIEMDGYDTVVGMVGEAINTAKETEG